MIPIELLTAYRATRYIVDTSPVGSFTLRIGASTPAADRLCNMLGHRSWIFITACNPRSQVLPPPENAARMVQLESVLKAHHLPFFPGAGIGDDPAWDPEPSLFVPGVEQQLAHCLGKRFDQYAVVYGELGSPAQLLSIDDQ